MPWRGSVIGWVSAREKLHKGRQMTPPGCNSKWMSRMPYRRPRRVLPWIAALCLASCAAAPSDPAHVNDCQSVPLAGYSPAQQNQVASEMDKAAPGAEWPALVRDYGRERAMLRACQSVAP